ncbi:helix-turn-helix domain-containing protein [Arthrobacter gengyunqii]|uniref:Helix-turn-helix domain-containing protein n=1 Tax=Arthrobacter gengyunqii TaxID=2886940 RepID=A0A9X1S659_9MICC|nr:helix-turn-helix domain-containing protein [Arthrobacter gengyunqii]MCC3265991.1 helix-turn-helix domain-containing protein [Arthrobacter gengyunqii]MCC3268706.1 helix-turn-helix domain-containing protein [Arthrobacter gengyunqii]UOY96091.1 helix-turn-helix domain-containing protein [Arthrobacter gengyunqii]
MTLSPRHTSALPAPEVRALSRALSAGDVTVFVDGTALRLPAAARDAVLDLLVRLGRGEGVVVGSGDASEPAAPRPEVPRAEVPAPAISAPGTRNGSNVPLLTTSQAAAAAGISHTYLRNLTDAGIIPVEYRGTHRRIRLSDVEAWLRTQQAAKTTRAQDGGAPVQE